MDVPFPAPLTAEQIAVVAQAESAAISDDYFRGKLAEAQVDVDRGDVAPWEVAELKQELRERMSRK
jgi:hypothetical protein